MYSKSKRLTANVVVGSGNGQLGKALFKEVRRRALSKVQQTTEKLERIKKRLRLLVKRAAAIRKAERNYKKWKNVDLKDMIRFKKNPANNWRIPTRKAKMQAKWLVVRSIGLRTSARATLTMKEASNLTTASSTLRM